MLRQTFFKVIVLTAVPAATVGIAFAQSNIDPANKSAWGENVGWTNWRDANGGAQGVAVGGSFMAGFIWGENVGWINVGDGTPGALCGGLPCYANATGADFGVNIDADGDLHGYAWGENIGWINFDGGALAGPPQPARIACPSPPDQPLARLTGFVWGENVGWINLAVLTAGQFVAVEAAGTPTHCDDGACCIDGVCFELTAEECVAFICDVAALLPPTFAGCFGDADGNGIVNAGDRGFISANIGRTDDELICVFDLDGNGVINPGDRGQVSANVGLCIDLPDYQNGSGLNGGVPDTRFAAAMFMGLGTTCETATCP